MKGAIIVNGYFSNEATENQVNRLTEEFFTLGINVYCFKSNEILTVMEDGEAKIKGEEKLVDELLSSDFIIYLNKDLYQAFALEEIGLKLFNNANAIRKCDDKMLTFAVLSGENVKMPKTISSPIMYSNNSDEDFVKSVESEIDYPIIVKNVHGSMGKGVYKADNYEELSFLFNQLKLYPHIYQQSVGELGKDTRVIVVGGKVVGAIKRESKTDFRSNVELGGKATACQLNAEQITLCEKVATVLDLDYAGIDILTGKDGEYLCEVNSNAFFLGMEKATGINIAKAYAEHIVKKIKGE